MTKTNKLASTLFLIFFIFLQHFTSRAAPGNNATNPLLKCIGKEEMKLHKERTFGAIYTLNQVFINELIKNNDIRLKNQYVDKVCDSSKLAVSVNLLKYIMLKGKEIFDLTDDGDSVGDDQTSPMLKLSTIESLKSQIPYLFFQFLSSMDAETAFAGCLALKIPEIKEFLGRYEHLSEDFFRADLEANKTRVALIFKKLENFEQIKKDCQKIHAKMKKESKKSKRPEK